MAVRNFDAIQRKGAMIAEQRQNAFNLKRENFRRRIELLKSCREDALDAIDTINALYENGLHKEFEKWMEKADVRYYVGTFYVKLYKDGDSTEVRYTPKTNNVLFQCHFCGMIDGCNTNSFNETDFLQYRLKSHHYDEALTLLSTALKPFLNGFFAWVETL